MYTNISCLMLTALLVFGAAFPHAAKSDESAAPVDSILVFDASGSMWARMDGVEKIVVARDVVSDLLKKLPEQHRIGLIAYGHNRKGDCSDIEMLAPIGTDHAEISEMVQGIVPKGMTPMTDAVIQAAEELKYTENEATVILVSDGEETCHDDPCQAAQTLAELGVGLTVHTIGFGLESAEAQAAKAQLQCMAEETGGKFFLAHDAGELRKALEEVSTERTAADMTIGLHATDMESGPVIEEDLVWTVSHGSSGEILYQSEQPEGSTTIETPRGVHDVAVMRQADGAGAEGEIAPDTATAGETIRIEWDGPDKKDDYIGVFNPEEDNRSDLHFTYTKSGSPLSLKMPEEAGTYEIRYVLNNNHKTLATHTIELDEVQATLSAPDSATAGETIRIEWEGPDYNGDYIGVFKTDAGNRDDLHYTRTSQGSPLKLKMPEEAGTYEVRYILQNSKKDLANRTIEIGEVEASMELPDSATAGETIRVEWDGPDYKGDYIGVFKTDAGNRDDLHYTRTSQGSPLKLKMPEEAGTYEVRYILQNSKKDLATRTIKIGEVEARLDAPDSATAGETIRVEWDGPDYKGDYIGVFKTDAGNRDDLHYTRTSQGSPLKLKMPEEAGTYEIRYVLSSSRRDLDRKTIQIKAVD